MIILRVSSLVISGVNHIEYARELASDVIRNTNLANMKIFSMQK